MKIGGKTFIWKKELRAAGLSWNPQGKYWEGELNDSFAAIQVRRGIESGEIFELTPMHFRNGPGWDEIDNLLI